MSVQAFSDFLNSNPDVASKVASCATYDEVALIAKANGFSVTGAELTRFAAQATSELSDEALEAVAGGSWTQSSDGDKAAAGAAAGSAVSVGSAVYTTISLSVIVK